jgi:excisionase family DNA binding protein
MIDKPISSNTPKLLLTSREAAELLSISERTLWTLTKAGSIAVVKIGGSKRYAISDLERFIANQTRHETNLATNNSPQILPPKHSN